eukprot:CAMPEP_0113570806 /NCGR_PEP_ID=MMETSP0015_2-20120614/25194_1 /TAXON_ID=2838 /ORGANISM="Odontella" /LENGTH=1141 /DNA_ID=CAMNT_0000473669 /DNA_START=256 /DNA_END=3681 /DNA_ORIENTATION=- /assembly_acc=CAM_ASM_000160
MCNPNAKEGSDVGVSQSGKSNAAAATIGGGGKGSGTTSRTVSGSSIGTGIMGSGKENGSVNGGVDGPGDRRGSGASAHILKDAKAVKALTASVNAPQALEQNLKNLHSDAVGGIDGMVELLDSHPEDGVAPSSVERRRELYGCNSLPSAPPQTFWQLFVDTFDDTTVQILMVAAIVSLAIGMYEDPSTGYVEGVAILAAVLVVSVVTAVNDYEKEKQFRALSEVNDDVPVLVVRGGKARQIQVGEIVLGDLVCVEAGDNIPCDGVLVACDGMEIDESPLTGEPIDVDKDLKEDPFVLSGCAVTHGSARFLAVAVGRDSQWGVIKAALENEQDQTPLQEKLDDMAALIGYVGMAAAAATFVAMMFVKLVVKPAYLDDVSVFNHALDAFIIGVTIVVVAVPEGLPLAVTISLAYSTKKMLADQNLIRHLHACETMGNATNICSDKTGTLTENRMTVVKGVFADIPHDDTAEPDAIANMSGEAREIILQVIATCSTARVVPFDPEDAPANEEDLENELTIRDTRPQLIGNKTEAALLILARSKWGGEDNVDARRASANFGKEGGSRLFPFSSARKRMSVLVNESFSESDNEGGITKSEVKNAASNWTLYHKGAAETVLADCTKYLASDGSEKPLTAEKRAYFESTIKSYASSALRCVALAHRRSIDSIIDPAKATAQCASGAEEDMCLDALVGIADPLRHDVVEAVATCQRAGIHVRMVTGDNLDTARAIAKEAGILTDDGLAMIGEDFRKLTPAQLDEILPRLQVLARSSPEDKHFLVQRLNGGLMPSNEKEWLEVHPGRDFEKEKDNLLPGYQEEWSASRGGVGEVVGVTGDGTNDGPALKAADVGLSMGISGTDVAKNASDIIIMDDKFSSIIKAVLWGRSVFDNIRKFLQFQLTVNVVALTITFLSAVAGYKPPLNAVMMLWVNLIMDTMGALALGTEPPTLELLDRRPYKRDASLINRPMWRNILIQAGYQLALLVFLLQNGPEIFDCEDGSRHHFTIIFNAFVYCQIFNEFNARDIADRFDPFQKMTKSPMFVAVILFTVLAQWGIVEYGGDFTQTHPLDAEEWKSTILLGFMSIPVGFIMRQVPISEDPDSFAGIGKDGEGEGKKKEPLGFVQLISLMVPIIAAGYFQWVKEGVAAV